jgi:hypothetical protein
MVVTERAGTLQLTFGPNWRGPMEYWNADNFRVKFDTPCCRRSSCGST